MVGRVHRPPRRRGAWRVGAQGLTGSSGRAADDELNNSDKPQRRVRNSRQSIFDAVLLARTDGGTFHAATSGDARPPSHSSIALDGTLTARSEWIESRASSISRDASKRTSIRLNARQHAAREATLRSNALATKLAR